jgi:predicted metal-dependent phosphoesterase TrpH
MFTDLHLHTFFSDGTYSPEELAGEASRFNLSAIALTDHDTVDGCQRLAAACASRAIEFIPGTELTAEIRGSELHMIGYFIDVNQPELLVKISHFQKVRQDRIREMVERLNRMNIPLDVESVFAIANCNSPGRPHIGRALVQAGV